MGGDTKCVCNLMFDEDKYTEQSAMHNVQSRPCSKHAGVLHLFR